mmetsp:Transcript_31312/g.76384  ORF Transcript_31312/g.76384 Transcript_31312/m.76384 type:complete len:216 (+) Transcript_31312:715-1362(+)
MLGRPCFLPPLRLGSVLRRLALIPVFSLANKLEIGDFHHQVPVDEEVHRLEVPVADVGRVEHRQAFRGPEAQREAPRPVPARLPVHLLEDVVERPALAEFEDDGDARRQDHDAVALNHVGILAELGEDPGLGDASLDDVDRDVDDEEQLDGHRQALVLAAVDLARPAGADHLALVKLEVGEVEDFERRRLRFRGPGPPRPRHGACLPREDRARLG